MSIIYTNSSKSRQISNIRLNLYPPPNEQIKNKMAKNICEQNERKDLETRIHYKFGIDEKKK